jgi:fucose 4-O-acetylase-like acetyltransferase
MRKIKDRVLLGTVAGLAGSAISMAIQYGAFRMGWTSKTWAQRATGATVSKKYLKTRPARFLGSFTALYVNAYYGIAQAYMYSFTGRDQLVVKVTGSGVFSWLVLHGLSSRLTRTFDPDDSPPHNSALSLLTALVDSYICGVIITRLGDDSLFPSQTKSEKTRLHEQDEQTQTLSVR